MRFPTAVALVVVATMVGGCGSDRVGNGGPFSGERIEIVIPFREGGGSDTWGRAIAPFLQQHLGEDVTVQTVNVLGASGVQGGNDFALRRRHDGLSLFVSSGSNALPYLLGERAVRYDFADFAGVLGAPTGGVVYVSSDLGIRDASGLCRADGLVYGGISPTGLDMVPLIAFELLELVFDPILGYQGKGAARLAFEQGETNLDYQTSSAYLANVVPLVEDGAAVPMFSFGVLDDSGAVRRDPVFAELPSLADAYETCHGSPPSGPEWEAYRAVLAAGFAVQKNLWVHGDAPPERIAALRAAAESLVRDAEFLSVMDDLIGGYGFYTGEAVDRNFAVTTRIPDAAKAWILEHLRGRYNVAI